MAKHPAFGCLKTGAGALVGGLLIACGSALAGVVQLAIEPVAPPVARPFELSQVRLLPGPFQQAQDAAIASVTSVLGGTVLAEVIDCDTEPGCTAGLFAETYKVELSYDFPLLIGFVIPGTDSTITLTAEAYMR